MATANNGERLKQLVHFRPKTGHFIMALVLMTLGFYLIYPVLLLLINSFNVADNWFRDWEFGLDNWRNAFATRGLAISLWNSILVWILVVGISFPIAVAISWLLARTNIPFSNGLEFMFWVSFMMPGISTTIAWMTMLNPDYGFINILLEKLPFIEDSPLNIFSLPGIVWAHIMANGISIKVMLLTPAFRNMDATMEEAARVNGANNLRTLLRVTLPLMVSPMALVFALQLLRIFQSFEIEYLLGSPFGFFVYSTKIYALVRGEASIPDYGQATVLASLTLLLIAVIIPFQRWILTRRRYTTITGSFKPGLIDLGAWRWWVAGVLFLLLFILTIGPVISLVMGSLMTKAGWFDLNTVWSLKHWDLVLNDRLFTEALKTTLVLAVSAAIGSPILFSVIAYILVRSNLPGRLGLDLMIWVSGAIPGILSGLGLLWLFLDTPGLSVLYGTIYALMLVVVIQGKTTGTNILKGVFVQVGADMEEAARVAGAGWVRTYFRIWIPLLMPSLILIATMNFVTAASTTSSIVLLASRGTMTLSLLALEYASPGIGLYEEASIVGLIIMAMTVGLAIVARAFGLKLGVRHERQRAARDNANAAPAGGPVPQPAGH
jgi:iron(III) transport system permease protein